MRTLTAYGIGVVIVLAVLNGAAWQAGNPRLHADQCIFRRLRLWGARDLHCGLALRLPPGRLIPHRVAADCLDGSGPLVCRWGRAFGRPTIGRLGMATRVERPAAALFAAVVLAAMIAVFAVGQARAQTVNPDAPAAMSGLGAALERYRPYVLSILRIVVALLYLQHGTAKVLGFPTRDDMPAFPKPEWFAGRIELVGSTLIIARAVHAPGGLHLVRRNGVCLFHEPPAAELLSAPQRRRARGPVLLCVSVSGLRRRRTVGPGCAAVGELGSVERRVGGKCRRMLGSTKFFIERRGCLMGFARAQPILRA